MPTITADQLLRGDRYYCFDFTEVAPPGKYVIVIEGECEILDIVTQMRVVDPPGEKAFDVNCMLRMYPEDNEDDIYALPAFFLSPKWGGRDMNLDMIIEGPTEGTYSTVQYLASQSDDAAMFPFSGRHITLVFDLYVPPALLGGDSEEFDGPIEISVGIKTRYRFEGAR